MQASLERLWYDAAARPETCPGTRWEAMQRSQTSSSPCLCRLDLSSPRGNEKRGPRSEACHETMTLFGAAIFAIGPRSKSASRARPVAVLMGTQRRDFANELCLSSTHYQRAAETGTSIEKTARETATD